MIYGLHGFPGCGKSCYLAWLAHRFLKKGIRVYSNLSIPGVLLIDYDDLGRYEIVDGVVLLDELGIDANNRFFKSMTPEQIEFWKLHRHDGLDIYATSQAYDYDATIRRLEGKFYTMKAWAFGFSLIYGYRMIEKKDTEDGLPAFQYLRKLIPRLFFRPITYRWFNSFERKERPKKDFPVVPGSMFSTRFQRKLEKKAVRRSRREERRLSRLERRKQTKCVSP